MKLERITLENFRNYDKIQLNFGQVSLVVAPNGVGKTNLLEAIYLLSTGYSPRAGKIEEMVRWGSESGRVVGVVESDGEREELAVVLTRGVLMGKKVPKRRLLIDGVGRARAKFGGRLVASWFRPEDMRLVEGSPSRRRGYLDETLVMASTEYERALGAYSATLLRRNRLLDQIREGKSKREELSYWDQSLVKNGDMVNRARRSYFDKIMTKVIVPFGEYEIEYKDSSVSLERLEKHREAEIAMGYTLVGPHKDDFVIKERSDGRVVDLMTYGSRGEQRLGVLYLKIASMEYVEKALGVKSLLLLDDIFSELDETHRVEVAKLSVGRQVIMSTAEPELSSYLGSEVKIINL